MWQWPCDLWRPWVKVRYFKLIVKLVLMTFKRPNLQCRFETNFCVRYSDMVDNSGTPNSGRTRTLNRSNRSVTTVNIKYVILFRAFWTWKGVNIGQQPLRFSPSVNGGRRPENTFGIGVAVGYGCYPHWGQGRHRLTTIIAIYPASPAHYYHTCHTGPWRLLPFS